jgi:hypothetical protein
MSDDAAPSDLRSARDVARRWRKSPVTVVRWTVRGVLGPGGERVRLKAVRVGGRWATTEEWIAEFFARLVPR